MLTKKDFKAIAEIIKRNNCWKEEYYTEKIAKAFADYFATQNPRFDRERFMQACELIK